MYIFIFLNNTRNVFNNSIFSLFKEGQINKAFHKKNIQNSLYYFTEDVLTVSKCLWIDGAKNIILTNPANNRWKIRICI